MPKFQLTETYKYSSNASDLTNFTAYIPVKGAIALDDSSKEYILVNEPELYTSYNQLVIDNYYDETNKVFNYSKAKKYDDQETNYAIIRKLLEKGLPVLIEGVEEVYSFTSYDSEQQPLATGKVAILGEETANEVTYTKVRVIENTVEGFVGNIYYYTATGNKLYTKSGDIYTDTGMTVGLGTGTYSIDFNRLIDKALYNIRFFTLGTYNTNKDLNQEMIKCAAERKDAIALVDELEDLSNVTVASIYTKLGRVGKVRSYFENLVKYTESSVEKTLSNDILKNAGAFTPWFTATLNQIDRTNTTPEDTEVELHTPASFGYLSTFIDAIKQNPEWSAIAGSFRGKIKEFSDIDYNYTSAEVEILQGRAKDKEVPLDDISDNIGMAINPISKIIPFGYLINGNRTMYIGDAKETNRPNYRAILSIRNLVATLVKQLYYASKKYTFEPNTDITYINFESELTPTLDKMRSGLGIRGYKITRLITTAKGRISANINIKPIEPVEDFDLYIELDETLDVIE